MKGKILNQRDHKQELLHLLQINWHVPAQNRKKENKISYQTQLKMSACKRDLTSSLSNHMLDQIVLHIQTKFSIRHYSSKTAQLKISTCRRDITLRTRSVCSLRCIVLYSIVLYCILMYYITHILRLVQNCVMYNNTLFNTTLYCI